MQYEIKKLPHFDKWLTKQKDLQAKISIARRIERMSYGNFGDFKSIGDKIFELRISKGAGYRVYYTFKNKEIVILLCGGDKSTQQKDINLAKKLIKEL